MNHLPDQALAGLHIDVQAEDQHHRLVLQLSGELHHENQGFLAKTVEHRLTQEHRQLILEGRNLRQITDEGVAALLLVTKRLRQQKQQLTLVAFQTKVLEKLGRMHILGMIPHYASLEEACS